MTTLDPTWIAAAFGALVTPLGIVFRAWLSAQREQERVLREVIDLHRGAQFIANVERTTRLPTYARLPSIYRSGKEGGTGIGWAVHWKSRLGGAG